MMEMKMCRTCKFRMLLIDERPCATCSEVIGEYGKYNYQPRLKRKELEAQLTTANAEIESMHRELAAKDAKIADQRAIIDEQAKHVKELERENLRLAHRLRLFERRTK